MRDVSMLLWDVGGVLLSNAWDHVDRRAAAEHFGIEWADLEARHDRVAAEFETGRLSLRDYLAATVFYVPRDFTTDLFQRFMFDRSTAFAPALSAAKAIHQTGTYLTVALNNESTELNLYRIRNFRLADAMDLFLSSCFTGRRKPDPEAYDFALEVTQRLPEEGLLVDDRPENIEAADRAGLRTLLVRDPMRLPEELKKAGISAGE
jgi:putative hydrolase of the HAD superfamily